MWSYLIADSARSTGWLASTKLVTRSALRANFSIRVTLVRRALGTVFDRIRAPLRYQNNACGAAQGSAIDTARKGNSLPPGFMSSRTSLYFC